MLSNPVWVICKAILSVVRDSAQMKNTPPIPQKGSHQKEIVLQQREEILQMLRSGWSMQKTFEKYGGSISSRQQFSKLVNNHFWPELSAIRAELAARKRPSPRPIGTQSSNVPSPAVSVTSPLSADKTGGNGPGHPIGRTDHVTPDPATSSPMRPNIRLGQRTPEELFRSSKHSNPTPSVPDITIGDKND